MEFLNLYKIYEIFQNLFFIEMAKLTESIAFAQQNILLIRYEQGLKNILNILLNFKA